MQRIEGATATKDNKFTEGSIEDNTSGTIVTANFLNAIQEEICNVIEHDGTKLDKNDNKQLNNVIEKRINVVSESIKISHSVLLNYYNSLKYFVDKTNEIAIKIKNSIASDDNNSNVVADSKSINLKSSVINFVADSLKWDKRASDSKDLVNKEYLDLRSKKYATLLQTFNDLDIVVNGNDYSDLFKPFNSNKIRLETNTYRPLFCSYNTINNLTTLNNKKNGLTLNKEGFYIFHVKINIKKVTFYSYSNNVMTDTSGIMAVLLSVNNTDDDLNELGIKNRFTLNNDLTVINSILINTPESSNLWANNPNIYSFKLLAYANQNEDFSVSLKLDLSKPLLSTLKKTSVSFDIEVYVEYLDEIKK